MAKAVELIVPDVHNNLKVYSTLESLVDKEISKVFLVGDLRDKIDYSFIQKNSPSQSKELFEHVNILSEKLAPVISSYGSQEAFASALKEG